MKVALVPIKGLDAGKSRLLGTLPRTAIEDLSLAMLNDVLGALTQLPEADHTVVVTPDPDVGKAAEQAGAEALVLTTPGLNPSLDEATHILAGRGLDHLLVLLGDVAGARTSDLQALFAAQKELGEPAVVLAPSSDGGTAALLRAPFDAIPSCFGSQSARAHERAAAAAGIAFRRCALPSLAIDLDRPDDLEALLASDAPAPRTRALLGELGIGITR
ncbi:MAG: 2-phospho-L-lactate guanylyltransferase [bacterium]|nr:2-phospho-L-lactate guanylyltransferase [bacterium]MCP5065652.1 2-phospho-L-lactate guanylyltransferase [bacterium]